MFFLGNQYFFKGLGQNHVLSECCGSNARLFPNVFAQIWYFSNVLGTNTIFQKYFGYEFDELEMLSAEITYFFGYFGVQTQCIQKA